MIVEILTTTVQMLAICLGMAAFFGFIFGWMLLCVKVCDKFGFWVGGIGMVVMMCFTMATVTYIIKGIVN